MSKKKKPGKKVEEPWLATSTAFAAYRAEATKLARLQARHRAALDTLAASKAGSREFDKAFDREASKQEKELLKQRQTVLQAYAVYKEKSQSDKIQIADPFNHAQYAGSPYIVGSYKLARPDQLDDSGDEDLSHCGSGSPKLFWKIGWHYLTSREGISFTHIPFPLYESEGGMPLATNERQWFPTYYAVDGPVADTLRMGVQGANGSANFTIAYGIDIGDVSPCGVEFAASSEATGVVDVGGYVTSQNTFPHVDLDLTIDVYQYRCLGAPIADVDLNQVPFYRCWNAFPPLSFETWAGEEDLSRVSYTTPGLYSIEPFRAEVNKRITDVQAGDSFLFIYHGGVFASQSGVQLSHNNVGTWVVREPVMIVRSYPAPPDLGNMAIYTG